MLNINKDKRDSLFIDIDGVICKHNYDPENIPDELIESTIKWLKSLKNTVIILTTSRTLKHALLVKNLLEDLDIEIFSILYLLPTGKRIIINDYKPGESYKANAINLERDVGI